MAKTEATTDRDSARIAQREGTYQEVDDLVRGAGRVADSAWYAGRSLIGDTCGLLSQFVVAFGRALAPSGDYTQQQRPGPGTSAIEPRSDTKAP